MKIVYTPQAKADLKEIRDYIKTVLQNPTAAQNITTKVIRNIHLLSAQPYIGISLSEKTGRDTEYRCLISGNYGVFYLVKENHIQIIRILDLRTDYMKSVFADD